MMRQGSVAADEQVRPRAFLRRLEPAFNRPAMATVVRDDRLADELSLVGEAQPLAGAGFYGRSGKRLVDIAVSAGFLLLVGVWLFPLLAVAIRLDSKGPAFFRQRRVGAGGNVFECLKFRTMTHAPEAPFVQAQQADSRVTRLGRLLRKSNCDELPQFINVLRGEMSVVGPRPHVPELDALFGEGVSGYRQRTNVRPGVTGIAQVSGCRGETRSVREMRHRVRFDLFYIRNITLWVDLKIIAATVRAVLVGDKKAY